MVSEQVEVALKELEAFEENLLELGRKMHPGTTFPLDLLANAVLDRSLHLIFGFTTLVRAENYISACHLVRCHLDNLLRFSAAWLVNNPHDLATQVINGKKLSKLRDREGKFLEDWYLCDKLNEEYPWIKNVYSETSGFIHLSKKHVFISSQMKDPSKGILEMRISKYDYQVTDEYRLESINGMKDITRIVMSYIEGWTWTKNNPGLERNKDQ